MNKEFTTTSQNTPNSFVDPYIASGYRHTDQPYSFYVKSLFWRHNESFNIYSSLIGTVFFSIQMFYYDWSDRFLWPLIAENLMAVYMFFTSSIAHLFHHKSERIHENCFLIDYTGVCLFSFGSSYALTFYSSPTWYYQYAKNGLVYIFAFMNIISCLMNSFSIVAFTRPYPQIKTILQMFPVVLTWLCAVAPVFLANVQNSNTHHMQVNMAPHVFHVVICLFGSYVFASDIPQRYFPACFDFFGHSHHILHVCSILTVFLLNCACYEDYMKNIESIRFTRYQPTFEVCFIVPCLLLVYF
jgi:adiponectin receptor